MGNKRGKGEGWLERKRGRERVEDKLRDIKKKLELIINCLARRCLVGGIRLVFAVNDAF